MPEQPILMEDRRRDPLANEVTRRLLDYLLSGDIRPGGRLPPERKLAEMFQVGRTVLREALKSLSFLGLIDVRQGDGNYLRSTESEFLPRAIEWGLLLGAKTVNDLVEARQVLEVAIIGLAAARIDDETLRALEEIVAAMEQTDDVETFIAADVQFHRRIAEATGNETLQKIVNNMLSLLRVWVSRVMNAETDFAEIRTQHRRILRALQSRNSADAAAAMQLHLSDVLRRLEKTIPDVIEP